MDRLTLASIVVMLSFQRRTRIGKEYVVEDDRGHPSPEQAAHSGW